MSLKYEETRADRVSSIYGQLNYYFTFVNYASADIDSQKFREQVRPIITNRTCTNPDLKPVLENGMNLRALYNGNDDVFIAEIIIKPEDCGY